METRQRIYIFTILYTREGHTSTLGDRQVIANTDAEAYAWLCDDPDYRRLADADIVSVYLKSYWVPYAS